MALTRSPRSFRRLRLGAKTAAAIGVALVMGVAAALPSSAADVPVVREEHAVDSPTDAPPTRPAGTRIGAGMVGLGDGSVLYFGGMTLGGLTMSDTWLWNDGRWIAQCGTSIPGATGICGPSARVFHGMSGSNGRAVLFGGVTDFDLDRAEADTWIWEGEWRAVCGTGATPCAPTMRMGRACSTSEATPTSSVVSVRTTPAAN